MNEKYIIEITHEERREIKNAMISRIRSFLAIYKDKERDELTRKNAYNAAMDCQKILEKMGCGR